MAKSRDALLVSGATVPELVTSLNFVLQRIADRLDAIEGLRGHLEAGDIDAAGSIVVTDDDSEEIHSLGA